MVAEPAVDEGQQVALGMFVVELFDDLRRQFLRQPLVEARTGGQPLQACPPLQSSTDRERDGGRQSCFEVVGYGS